MAKTATPTTTVHRSKEYNKAYGYAPGLSTVQARADHKREVDAFNLHNERMRIRKYLTNLRTECKSGAAEIEEHNRAVSEFRAKHPRIVNTWLENVKVA